ncbi:CoA transferase [Desulfitobacterium chlororespirans]|uniref:L-carnitine CoA-transferase n=1 Tax=Desulfitobacterium chlororespirans DSM 11544 TaxID=1121395 RepID=A0A1M7UZ74_9FIRM|nr:CoA transferase [Desulfitobacterium chlororespirans]SHN88268.1 L-carnitine CoA-transferase [Desulfitobacterium chlororespirans DSM 11544]
MKSTEIPKFGPLAGVKVVSVGMSVAGPYAPSLMADFGADVIFIENPAAPDVCRQAPGSSFEKERKNHRSLVLNIPTPEGKEALLAILKKADILIETSKGGQWAKWGLTDEVLWQANPKLVIGHVSGFGQTGDPEYVARGSWDSIGQAFGGYMNLNGNPEPEPPAPAAPYTCDYLTAMSACWSCLAAYIHAQKTGQGESIDIAQFEAALTSHSYTQDYLTHGIERKRSGPKSVIAGWQGYQCKDGQIFTCFIGPNTMKKGLPLIGLDPDAPEYKGKLYVLVGEPGSEAIVEAMKKFCAARTVNEADLELNHNGIAASPIMTFEMMKTHPHYIAREEFIEWETFGGYTFKSTNIFPRMKNNPGKVWRPAPLFGMDNDDILEEAGLTPDQIKVLYENKVIAKA